MSRRIFSTIFCLCLLLALYGCGGDLSGGATDTAASASASSGTTDTATASDNAAAAINIDGIALSVTDRDSDASYDETAACKITFSSDSVEISGDGAVASGTTVTISAEGTYIVSGSCSDGQLVVTAGDDVKLQIVLDGLTLTSADSCPLLITEADKVFLTLASGSNNSLADASSYSVSVDDSTVDAAIFSKADLTINGTGSLTVTGNYKHAVVSKDDLIITGGTISITSQKVGLEGKDCVKLTGGTITVTSGTDGVRSTNTEDTTRGYVYLGGADLTIIAGTDGIQAETLLYVSAGTIAITTGDGSGNVSTSSGWGSWGSQPGNLTGDDDTSSAKGLKSSADIEITGGTITVDSSDDSVHAGNNILISGGTLSLASGDDGVHSDLGLTIEGGTVVVSQSYEGLEAVDIAISGGEISVTASDDGLNAAGGNDQSSVSGRPGQNGFSESGSQTIVISGGYLIVNASGDGVDSNGSITVTGGVTLVSGPTDDGNGALDCGDNSSATISGGIFLAVGSSGMAVTFDDSSSQGSIMANVTTQSAGKTVALCDNSGNVLVSFTPAKQYTNIVVSTPEIASGETYILCIGSVSGADANGYATNTTISGSTVLTTITMTSLHYSEQSSGGQGGTMGGGMGGGR